MGLGYGWVESAFLRPKRLGPGVVVIREVRVGFGCSFVVGSDRGEFDLILGLDFVLGLCFGFTVQRRKVKGKQSRCCGRR